VSRLLRVSELVGRPVVTLGGDDLAQVRDVVFAGADGDVVGFTLAKRSRFGGPLKEVVAWPAVLAVGPDAVMVADEQALTAGPLEHGAAGSGPGDGDVIGDRVVTDGGVELGQVVDAVVEVAEGSARIVGFEMEPAATFDPAHGRKGRRLFIPRSETLTASNQAVVVPSAAVDYVADDLAGFGEAIDGFRARLRGENT
jgi:sporulation protein YlmC with PRC-barrel domain